MTSTPIEKTDVPLIPAPVAGNCAAFLATLKNRFRFEFKNLSHLTTALTHKSFRNEHRYLVSTDNERFEFLGDAVLNLVLSDLLMKVYWDQPEGVLSKRRASLVNESTLAEIALELNLQDVIKLGRGEQSSGGASKPRLLASTLEAVFSAVFKDQGFESAHKFIGDLYCQRLSAFEEAVDFQKDYKTRLQEVLQRRGQSVPHYQLISSEGPEHEKVFVIDVIAGTIVLGRGSGRSKKLAEQDAACDVISQIENKVNQSDSLKGDSK